jgi:hypothetical protein
VIDQSFQIFCLKTPEGDLGRRKPCFPNIEIPPNAVAAQDELQPPEIYPMCDSVGHKHSQSKVDG